MRLGLLTQLLYLLCDETPDKKDRTCMRILQRPTGPGTIAPDVRASKRHRTDGHLGQPIIDCDTWNLEQHLHSLLPLLTRPLYVQSSKILKLATSSMSLTDSYPIHFENVSIHVGRHLWSLVPINVQRDVQVEQLIEGPLPIATALRFVISQQLQ